MQEGDDRIMMAVGNHLIGALDRTRNSGAS
jgi:hypothetical protein